MNQIMGIACPQIVYPYLRTNVADLVTRTGLPTIHLAEISFESMYQQRLAHVRFGFRRSQQRHDVAAAARAGKLGAGGAGVDQEILGD